jgi:hypothetical protein
MADGDAYELDASLVFAEGCEKRAVFLVLLGVFLVAAEVPAKAGLEDDERAVFPVEGAPVGGWVSWHSECVDDVGGCSRSCLP